MGRYWTCIVVCVLVVPAVCNCQDSDEEGPVILIFFINSGICIALYSTLHRVGVSFGNSTFLCK